MDKLRAAMKWLVHNRFWVTCVLVSIISVATWYIAWAKIDKLRGERVSSLKSSKTQVQSVINSTIESDDPDNPVAVHPNDGTKAGMNQRIKLAGEAALAAWQTRYEKQQALLQVSQELPERIRGPLISHNPMEKPIETELLTVTERQTFMENITKQMPLISEKISCQWTFNQQGEKIDDVSLEKEKRGQQNPRGAKLAVSKDLVRWHGENQELWNAKSIEFENFNGNESKFPTSQQILALQQDLWILEGIFDAVAEVNKGFTANDLAPIERIDHVLVGQDAIYPELGTLEEFKYRPPTSSGSSSGPKEKVGGGVKSKKQRRQENSANRNKAKKKKGKIAFNPGESQSPFHGRYVDRDFTQLNASAITEAITSDELTDQSYLAVAKRVPVRIAVKMDERRINDFLAAAANSPFAFEIRQVRINKHKAMEGVTRKAQASQAKDDGRGGLSMGGGPGGGGGQADGNSSGGRGNDSFEDGDFIPEIRANFDVKIEFIGIVKIYNPVNRSLIVADKSKDN